METFMAIVFLVFGILQIILFFKIWGMTNNVKKIKDKLYENDFPVENLLEKTDSVKCAFYDNIRRINKLIYLGKEEDAKHMLLSMKYDLEQEATNCIPEKFNILNSLSRPFLKEIDEMLAKL